MVRSNSAIQIGILGCGSFIQRRILPILKEVEEIDVTALQKRNLDEARQIALKWNIPSPVATREELLQLPQVEAVLIATRNDCHEEDAIACAIHSKPTLCEKPLAPTAASALRIAETFEKQATLLLVGQSLRFKMSVQKARELLRSGRLGQLLHIGAHFSIPVSPENWRYQKAFGGGVLQDIGIHLIDLCRFISREEFESVFALANPGYQNTSSESDLSIKAVGRLTNGATSSLECSFLEPLSSGFEVIGTKGRLVSCDSLRQTYDSLETLHLVENDTKIYYPIRASNIYVDELKHFAKVLKGEESPLIRAREGVQNQKVIDSIYQSLHEKREIEIR